MCKPITFIITIINYNSIANNAASLHEDFIMKSWLYYPYYINGLFHIWYLLPSAKWCVTRVMLRNLCKISARRSRGNRRILDWTLIGAVLSLGVALSYPFSHRARYRKSTKRSLYLSVVGVPCYYGFCDSAVNSQCYCPYLCAKLVIRRMLHAPDAQWHISLLLFLIITAVPTRARQHREDLWNHPGCAFLRRTAGALGLLMADRVRFDIQK